MRWLPEQLDSILAQRDVSVRVIALDDESTDGTRDWLESQAKADDRITVLPSMGASGGSAPNFYRLIADRRAGPDGLPRLQRPGRRLAARQARAARRACSRPAVTSASRRASPRSRRRVAAPSCARTSRSAGSTTSPRAPAPVRPSSSRPNWPASSPLSSPTPSRRRRMPRSMTPSSTRSPARRAGRGSSIPCPRSTTASTSDNVMGSNVGVGSAMSRLRLIREHWHRNQAILHAHGRHATGRRRRASSDRGRCSRCSPPGACARGGRSPAGLARCDGADGISG